MHLPWLSFLPLAHLTVFFVTFFTGVLLAAGAKLLVPEKVALAGAPKIEGCGEGAGRQEASVEHGGGEAAGWAMQGEAALQTCAS